MLHPFNIQIRKQYTITSLLVLVLPQTLVNKANLCAPLLLIDALYAPAVVNKNDLHASCLSMHVPTNQQIGLL